MLTGLIISLLVVGLILILLEFFVTPGFITGLLGGVAWLYALYKIYEVYGENSGHLALGGMLLLLVASIFIAIKSGVWNKVSLHENVEGKVNELPHLNIGDQGITQSACRPIGKAIFNGVIVEVSTYGELIQSNENIEIIDINNHKIIIKKI